MTLDQILDWWLALPKESQASQKSYEQLVQDVERAVEVLCIIWTRCELELPRTIHCDGHLDVDRERLRQLALHEHGRALLWRRLAHARLLRLHDLRGEREQALKPTSGRI